MRYEFEVGDWVITHTPAEVGILKPKVGEVFKVTAIGYSNLLFAPLNGVAIKRCRLATEAEVKQHLLAEAERRGFKTGVTYLNHSDDKYTADMNPAFWHQYSLYCGFAQGLIYDDEHNKWGTIVAKDKELCGHKVEQPASSSFIKIGCKAISRGEVQGFLNVCEKFDITRIQSSYVKDTIALQDIKEALK